MERIQFVQLPEMFTCIGNLFLEKKEELCEMDARLGDGDLGLTMSKGFAALPDLLRECSPDAAGDVGILLMKVSMKMSSLVPSTMGFLMASGIMEGGKAVKGKTEIDSADLSAYLCGFAEGIRKRGKCQAGQRTIYDSIKPAAEAAKNCVETNPAATLAEVAAAALQAAKAGVEATKDMLPVFGKAAVHAAKCGGVVDQGAVAGYYMILGMCHYLSA